MSKHAQIRLLSILLLLALLCMTFAAISAMQSVHDFQQQYSDAKAGKVSALRPWMTIQIISHIYRVPEDELSNALRIAKTDPLRHATLYEIANRKRKPVDQIVYTLQRAILTYRNKHPYRSALELTRWPHTMPVLLVL